MKHFSLPFPRWVSGSVWAMLVFVLASSTPVSAQITKAVCNTVTAVTSTSFNSLSVTSSKVAGFDEFLSKEDLIDNDPNFSTSASYLAALGSSAWLEVKDLEATGGNVYPAGTFAGFIINSTSIGGVITISTYLGTSNTAVDSKTFSSLANIGLLSGKTRLGINTTGAFDRIRIDYGGVVGTIRVYAPVIERFCGPSPALTCNLPNVLAAPAAPVYIDPDNTGLVGTVTVGSILNQDNAVSASTTDYASISLTAGVGTIGTFAIKNALASYTATASNGTFVGFDLSSTGLVTLSALSSLTVSTYLNGTATGQSVTGSDLISASAPILLGNGRGTVGFLATQTFDEVKLRVAAVLSTQEIRIYGAVIEPFCAGPSLNCADNTIPKNTITPLVNPTSPVYVNSVNTEITNPLACVSCFINNSGNIVDSDLSNYASISITAGIASTASVGVANALDTYPVNSFAGFDIETNSLLSANVFSTATIMLYNNGSLVQTGTGNGLIVGAASSPLLNGRSRQYIGIVANVPYDEVKISFVNLVNADLGDIRIYSAVFEKTCSAAISCNTTYNLSNPTFPVVINNERTGVTGAVSAATTVENPWNVVSPSTTDFAKINTTATLSTTASIAVLNPVDTYPAGTFAGFTVKKESGIVAADLFQYLWVTTYLDGVRQETRTATSLLDLSIVLFGATSDFFNIGFVTTKQFDEIQLGVGPLLGVSALSALGGSINVYGAFINTNLSIGNGFTCALKTSPDFAVTYKNVSVSGSVASNDNVPAGTTYGTSPTLVSSPNGSTPTLTMNSDGTYTFITSTSGVYVYSVPVCVSSVCVSQTLTVTVLDPKVNTNNPVANPDVASMTSTTATTPPSVTVNVKANDGPGNPGGTLGTPTIATPPTNGVASVDGDGNIVYTPNAGFYGTDVLTYQVCETPSTLCATATVTISVYPPGYVSASASDDYVFSSGTAVTGNVLTNDIGTGLTVSNTGTTVSSSGTLVITSTGSYTFTPALGYKGPGSFTYTACDSNTPSNCVTATLHVLVNIPDLSPTIILTQSIFNTAPDNIRNFIVNIFEANGQPTPPGSVSITISVPSGYTISFDNTLTSTNISGGPTVSVENSHWTVVNNQTDQQLTLKINSGQIIPANATAVLGFRMTRVSANAGSTANITVNVTNDDTKTYDGNPLNNVYARIISGQ